MVLTFLVGKDQLHEVHKLVWSLLSNHYTRLLHKVSIVVVPAAWEMMHGM